MNRCKTGWKILGLAIVFVGKDLQMEGGDKLNMIQKCDVSAEKANAIVDCIKGAIFSKSHEVTASQYSTMAKTPF